MFDPIVNEVRQIRDEHARKFNYDIDAICNDYKQKHSKYLNILARQRARANKKNAVCG